MECAGWSEPVGALPRLARTCLACDLPACALPICDLPTCALRRRITSQDWVAG